MPCKPSSALLATPDDSFSDHTQLSLEVRAHFGTLAEGFHSEASGDEGQSLLSVRSGTTLNHHFQQLPCHGSLSQIHPLCSSQRLGLLKQSYHPGKMVSHPFGVCCHSRGAAAP